MNSPTQYHTNTHTQARVQVSVIGAACVCFEVDKNNLAIITQPCDRESRFWSVNPSSQALLVGHGATWFTAKHYTRCQKEPKCIKTSRIRMHALHFHFHQSYYWKCFLTINISMSYTNFKTSYCTLTHEGFRPWINAGFIKTCVIARGLVKWFERAVIWERKESLEY